MVPLKFLITFFLLSGAHSFSFNRELLSKITDREIRKCLLNEKFYHKETRRCEYPLEQGPCDTGDWVMMTQEPGVVSCQPRPQKFSNCPVVLGPGGQVECAIKTASNLFQPCSGGILVPDNFQFDTMPCPHKFSCQPRTDVYYSSIKSATGLTKDEMVNHLKSLVCDVESKSICLPENNEDSLMTIDNILQSYQKPQLKCRKNPCPLGSRPSLDEAGYYRCQPDEVGVRSLLLTGANRTPCRRRQVFIYGRCRPRFFG